MSNIKKHQCPSCGGNLTVDNDKQMYYCKFCGSTYDYEYFREEQMHEMGETYLQRKEFLAAADAYRFILKKDPHDFLALRGLMLAAGHFRNIDELIREDKVADFSYKTTLVSEVVDGASEKDGKYFADWEKIYSDMKSLADCRREIENLSRERRRIDEDIQIKNNARDEYYFEDKNGLEYSPKSVFNLLWIVSAVILVITIICVVTFLTSGDRTAITLAVLLTLVNLVAVVLNLNLAYPRVKKINEIDTDIGELYAETGRLGEKIRDLEHQSDKLKIIIKTSSHNFVKKDKLIMNDLAVGN